MVRWSIYFLILILATFHTPGAGHAEDLPVPVLDWQKWLGGSETLPDNLSHDKRKRLGDQAIAFEQTLELDENHLRLWTGGSFVPMRVGSSEGHGELFLRGALLPAYDQEGITMFNYKHAFVNMGIRYPARVGPYRWFVRDSSVIPATERAPINRDAIRVVVVVDRVGVERPQLLIPRLEPGETRLLWLSTAGVEELELGSKMWDYDDGLTFNLSILPAYVMRQGWHVKLSMSRFEKNKNVGRVEVELHKELPGPQKLGNVKVSVIEVRRGADTTPDPSGGWAIAEDAVVPDVHVLIRVEHD